MTITIQMPRFNVRGDQWAFWDFLDDCLHRFSVHFRQLEAAEWQAVLHLHPEGMEEDEFLLLRDEAGGRAFDQFTREMEDLWNDDRSAALREFVDGKCRETENLRRQLKETDSELRETTNQFNTMQVRLEDWEVPPVCKCGALSYDVTCSVCHRDLSQSYRWEDN